MAFDTLGAGGSIACQTRGLTALKLASAGWAARCLDSIAELLWPPFHGCSTDRTQDNQKLAMSGLAEQAPHRRAAKNSDHAPLRYAEVLCDRELRPGGTVYQAIEKAQN